MAMERPYWMSSALGSLQRELLCGEQSASAFEINLEEAMS